MKVMDHVMADQLPPYETLFRPTTIGSVDLANRIALAPMTRVSATADGFCTDRMASYYRIFAEGGFGLLITEGTFIDEQESQGFLFQPGIAHSAHADAWRPAVDGVHAAGAKFFAQLMHGGSQSQGNSHSELTLGPSAIRPKGEQATAYYGSGPYRMPAAITVEQIGQVRASFVNAARLARDAGFDGVEIHGANGYLIDEFLTDYLNTRTDEYGGSVVNRVRLAQEICSDIVAAVGSDMAVGIRISQAKVSDAHHRWAGGEEDAATIFAALQSTGVDYIHTADYKALEPAFTSGDRILADLARTHSGLPIVANGHLDDPADAANIVASGAADVVALARGALANRNWPELVRRGQPIAPDIPPSLYVPVADLKDWEVTTGVLSH